MPRDGTPNLIPMNQRSEEEQKEMQVKGGKKSGETRRRQRDVRKAWEQVLKAQPQLNDKLVKQLEGLGIKGKGKNGRKYDVLTVSLAALGNKCMAGDVRALRLMLEILGQDSKSMTAREQMEMKTAAEPDQNAASPAYTSFLRALNEKAGDAFDDDDLDGEDVPAGLDDTPSGE